MVPAIEERTNRKCTLVAPTPLRVGLWSYTGKPPTLIGGNLKGYIKSKKLRLHIHSKQHVQRCSAYWESFKETLFLLKLSEALAGCGQP